MGVNYSPFANLPFPDENAARDIPGWFSLLVEGLDTSVILDAASATDRNSKYSNAPRGTVVTSTTDGTVWVKTSDEVTLPSTWGTLYSPPAAQVWTNVTLQGAFVSYGPTPQATFLNGVVRFRGLFGTATTTFGTNQYVAQIPSAVPFPDSFRSFATSCSSSSGGRVDVNPDGSIWFLPFSGLPTPFWASLDGISYVPNP